MISRFLRCTVRLLWRVMYRYDLRSLVFMLLLLLLRRVVLLVPFRSMKENLSPYVTLLYHNSHTLSWRVISVVTDSLSYYDSSFLVSHCSSSTPRLIILLTHLSYYNLTFFKSWLISPITTDSSWWVLTYGGSVAVGKDFRQRLRESTRQVWGSCRVSVSFLVLRVISVVLNFSFW